MFFSLQLKASDEPVTLVPATNSLNTSAAALQDSSLLGEERILDEIENEEDNEVDEELPPAFIPTPPPKLIANNEPVEKSTPPPSFNSSIGIQPQSSYLSETRFGNGKISHRNQNMGNHIMHHHHHHNSNVREGKAALDLLAERISNSKKFSTPDEQQLAVSHFVHDKRNIWAMFDRPFDEGTQSEKNRAFLILAKERIHLIQKGNAF
jgi:hypothetical protein